MVRVGAMVVGDLENEGGGEGNGESIKRSVYS